MSRKSGIEFAVYFFAPLFPSKIKVSSFHVTIHGRWGGVLVNEVPAMGLRNGDQDFLNHSQQGGLVWQLVLQAC